jgi:trehalose 6-phosphate synthase
MNLVAKEYVAAQDCDDPGVLILSRFAGAALECRDAILVNPYDLESVASAIVQALEMPLNERRDRHQKLFVTLAENQNHDWGSRFLNSLRELEIIGAEGNSWPQLASAASHTTANAE